MRFLSLQMRGSVERNDIFGFKWRYYGPKQYILDYGEIFIFFLLSYYILSIDNGL